MSTAAIRTERHLDAHHTLEPSFRERQSIAELW